MKMMLMIGRCAVVVGLACIVLSLFARVQDAPAHPAPVRTQHVKPATERERLEHELKQAWERDQAKR